DNNINENIINSYPGYGITLWYCSRYNIKGNIMTESGIWISSTMIEHWNTHNIDTLNTVNGKPVYYWKNQVGGTVPLGSGEIILANCSKVTIENQKLTNGSVGILLGFSSYNFINGNNVSSQRIGIYLLRSNENLIVNNTSFFNSQDGIGIGTSDGNMVVDNIASDNDFGVSIYVSTKNNVFKNNISNNNFDGMFLYNSDENNIRYNDFYSNERYGVWPRQSDANNITANNFYQNNEYGVYLLDSSYNYIYHNNMIENIDQAYDNRDNNYFDNGYPSGGNYWSDYFGMDLYHGVNQNIPGSDGIGDFPYTIDSDTQDNYPLFKPYRFYVNYVILKEGWNLISTQLIIEDQNPMKVLNMIHGHYDAVQWYDPTNIIDPWKHYKTRKPNGNDLSHLNETMGFWIHITQPGGMILLYNGTEFTINKTVTLHPGWNMVGYPSLTSYNRTVGLNNLTFGQQVDIIQWYDASTQTWYDMDENDYFVPGRGYWIHANIECEWEVPL
ncbi:MAG: right-handed parallel beta-helix repeat-containing protein, partial [Thermoplasmata archaeon]